MVDILVYLTGFNKITHSCSLSHIICGWDIPEFESARIESGSASHFEGLYVTYYNTNDNYIPKKKATILA